jgi:nickel-type superoxide dismutase maturation protease
MEPTLHPGQSVLLRPKRNQDHAPPTGDVVLIRHPREHHLVTVKRLAAVQGNELYVVGDNSAASTDSRSYGWVPMENLMGRIDCTFP